MITALQCPQSYVSCHSHVVFLARRTGLLDITNSVSQPTASVPLILSSQIGVRINFHFLII